VHNTININITITVPAGHSLTMTSMHDNVSNGSKLPNFIIAYLSLRSLSLEFKSHFQTTQVKCLKPLTLLKRLVDKMTDGKCTVRSDYFTNDATILAVSGDGLRGLADAVIKTSFSDFMQSYNAICCIGLGVEGTEFVVEAEALLLQQVGPCDGHRRCVQPESRDQQGSTVQPREGGVAQPELRGCEWQERVQCHAHLLPAHLKGEQGVEPDEHLQGRYVRHRVHPHQLRR
jgi:hypothetical protein